MYFKQVLNERCGCASYVIASRKTREATVIDPAIDTEPYEALLRERDFRLRWSLSNFCIGTAPSYQDILKSGHRRILRIEYPDPQFRICYAETPSGGWVCYQTCADNEVASLVEKIVTTDLEAHSRSKEN